MSVGDLGGRRNRGRWTERVTDDPVSSEESRALVPPEGFIQEFFGFAEENWNPLVGNTALHENRALGGCRRSLRVR